MLCIKLLLDFVILIIKILKDKLYLYIWNVFIKYIYFINLYIFLCILVFISIMYFEIDYDVVFNYMLLLVKYIFFYSYFCFVFVLVKL